MEINWTVIFQSAVTAGTIGIFTGISQFLAIRYIGRLTEHIEKKVIKNGDKKEV